MNKRIEQREQCVERLTAYVLKAGLAETSLRQLANAAGVSDRMLLYYFENKEDVMTAVLRRVALDLAVRLNDAMPESERLAPAALLEKGAALTRGRALQPYMRVSTEIAALAGRGEQPYASVASEIMGGFLAWVENRLSTEDKRQRKAEAAMLLAFIDGLAVISVGTKKAELDSAVKEMAAALRGR